MKKGVLITLLVFLLALLFNLIWENFHVVLYTGYDTSIPIFFLLFRASLWDASFITSVYLFTAAIFADSQWFNKQGRGKIVLVFVLTFTAAVLVEKSALSSGRWIYKELMPLLPYLNTGLSPSLQLFTTSLLSLGLVQIILNNLKSSS